MYYNGRQYTNHKGLNLLAANGVLRFEDVDTAPTTTSGEYLMYVDGGVLYFDNGSGTTALGAAGGSGSISWEQMYASDNIINIAGGNGLSVAGAMANVNDVFTVTVDAAASGSAIQITNLGSGNDIAGSSGNWSITKAGVATFTSIVLTSTISTDVQAITNNTITANNAFIVSGSGVFTGTGANAFANVTASGLTTGTALSVIANAATTSIGVVTVSATGQTSGSTLLVTGGGANITSGGKVVEVAMGAAITGAGVSIVTTGVHQGVTTNSILAITNNSADTGTSIYVATNGLTTGVAQLITSSGTMTTSGSLLTLTANSATTAAGILRINANALTSGIGAIIASSATAITGAGRMLKVDHTGSTGSSATLVEFATAATDETVLFKLTTAAMVDGVALSVVGTTGMTTGSLIRATSSTAGAVATNGVYAFGLTGAFTSTASTLGAFHIAAASTVSGTAVSILGGAMTTGIALNITDPSTGMTSGSLIRAITATTGTLATNGVVSFQASGDHASTTNQGFVGVIDATTAGTAVSVATASLTTGVGLFVSNATSGVTSGSLVRVAASGTGTIATNGIVSIRHAGIFLSTANIGVLDVAASALVGAGTVARFAATAASQTAAEILNVTQSGASLTAYTGSCVSITAGFSGNSSTGSAVLLTTVHTTAGDGFKIVANSLTVGTATGILVSHTTSVLGAGTSLVRLASTGIDTGTTTGVLLDLSSSAGVGQTNVMLTDSSADTALRRGIVSKVTNTAAVLARPFESSNVAVANSKFTKHYVMTDGTKTCTIWLDQDTTDPQGTLSGTAGDMLLNGPSNKLYFCTGTTNWTATT